MATYRVTRSCIVEEVFIVDVPDGFDYENEDVRDYLYEATMNMGDGDCRFVDYMDDFRCRKIN